MRSASCWSYVKLLVSAILGAGKSILARQAPARACRSQGVRLDTVREQAAKSRCPLARADTDNCKSAARLQAAHIRARIEREALSRLATCRRR